MDTILGILHGDTAVGTHPTFIVVGTILGAMADMVTVVTADMVMDMVAIMEADIITVSVMDIILD